MLLYFFKDFPFGAVMKGLCIVYGLFYPMFFVFTLVIHAGIWYTFQKSIEIRGYIYEIHRF